MESSEAIEKLLELFSELSHEMMIESSLMDEMILESFSCVLTFLTVQSTWNALTLLSQ